MNTDKDTLAGSTAAPPHGSLGNAALLSAVLVSAALLSALFLGGCESPVGDGISESGGGNVTLTFGKSDGRVITSGVDLPADVLASMRFEAKLSGPNRESLSLNAKWGETAQLRLRQGQWRIDAKAYQADSPNLAGTGSLSFEIQAKNNKIIVPMAMRDTAGAPLSCYEISVPGSANGEVETSFTAAYPGTTVTLTTAPAVGYVLHSLTYSDGTAVYTPSGGGNEYTFTMPDADITVSAAFTSFYMVTYSAGTGSGTVPEPAAVELGSSIILPAGSAPSDGIPFYSWEVDGTAYPAGASYTVTGNVTLTARWAFSSVSGIQAYLDGMSGGSLPADPLPLPVGITSVDTVWDALLAEILPTGKFVALDLSISTISGVPAVFNPASSSSGKEQIVSLVLPDMALSIPNGAFTPRLFDGFNSLKRVAGAGVIEVGAYAFSSCISLEEVNLPAAASIGSNAFDHCIHLAEVSFPAAASIGEHAFYYCSSLAKVSLPKAASIGNNAFQECSILDEVSLPMAASIGNNAFHTCISLTEVSFPMAASIGNNAFYGCSHLAKVSLPKAASIDEHAFYNCTSLAEVSLPMAASIGNNAFQYCHSLAEVSLPKATSIGNNAFQECSILDEVSLPSVTTIGNNVFDSIGGTSLTITMGNTAPTLGEDMFTGVTVPKNVTVKVPSGATGYGVSATYSGTDATDNWGNGFRGLGWNGSNTMSGALNSNVTLEVTH